MILYSFKYIYPIEKENKIKAELWLYLERPRRRFLLLPPAPRR
jgi:hypothetical protein